MKTDITAVKHATLSMNEIDDLSTARHSRACALRHGFLLSRHPVATYPLGPASSGPDV